MSRTTFAATLAVFSKAEQLVEDEDEFYFNMLDLDWRGRVYYSQNTSSTIKEMTIARGIIAVF